MKRTELRRKTPLIRGVSKLRRVAKRKQKFAADEAKWRRQYLMAHPFCMAGWVRARKGCLFDLPCTGTAIELHEIVKRSRGGSITDPENVVPICRNCHRFTEEYPAIATKIGLLASNPKWRQGEPGGIVPSSS